MQEIDCFFPKDVERSYDRRLKRFAAQLTASQVWRRSPWITLQV
jgi:hypothetical protein